MGTGMTAKRAHTEIAHWGTPPANRSRLSTAAAARVTPYRRPDGAHGLGAYAVHVCASDSETG
jgi:hypothetical protein